VLVLVKRNENSLLSFAPSTSVAGSTEIATSCGATIDAL